MIQIDQTLIFQVVGFFVLLLILNRLLFKPVQRIIQERDEKINGTLKKATETENKVEEGLKDYDQRLKEAAVKGHEERKRLKAEGTKKEQEIMDAARKEASEELSRMRGELTESRKAALAELKEQTRAISKDMASKALGRTLTAIVAVGALIAVPGLAEAVTEHGGGAEHGLLAILGGTWKIINFIILAVGVYLVWTKVVNRQLDARGEEIKNAIEEAETAKAEAEKKALEYQEKLSTLEGRIEEIRTELTLEGEAEKKKMEENAKVAAEQLKKDARLTADQEVKKARYEIRKEVAGLATEMAREILSRELKPEDQERLVKGYLDNLRLN